jgi:5-methylcytosine-specific restriction endonuclease McrA
MKFCKKCQCDTERYADGGCIPCRRAYLTTNVEKVKESRAAYRAANTDKAKAYAEAYRAANPEKVRAYQAAWQKANPEAMRIIRANRRARKRDAGGKLSKGLSEKLFKLQYGKCACCTQPLGDNYHLDHIMPLALGGSNTDDNTQLLRQRCNLQKKAKHPVDFMQSRGFLL